MTFSLSQRRGEQSASAAAPWTSAKRKPPSASKWSRLLSGCGLVACGAAALLGVAGLASSASAQCSSYNVTTTSGSIVPGTTSLGGGCDDCGIVIALPFTWSFYGVGYTTASADSNGYLMFGPDSGILYQNACLPAADFTSPTMCPFWDDLWTVYSPTGLFTSVSGTAPNRIFNIEWRTQFFPGTGSQNFEVRLYEGQNRFDYVYGDFSAAGTATIGCQQTPSVATQVSCNSSSIIPSGTVYSFDCTSTNPTASLTVSPNHGRIGDTITAFATVTPGTNPVAPIASVMLDASGIGAGSAIPLHDDGLPPDLSAGDGVYSGNFTVGAAAGGSHALGVEGIDDSGRTIGLCSDCSCWFTIAYCEPDALQFNLHGICNSNYEYISGVELFSPRGSLSHHEESCSSDLHGYNDYTSPTVLSAIMAVGDSVPLVVVPAFPNGEFPSDDYCWVWVDWDNSDAFDDGTGKRFQLHWNGTLSWFSGYITVPPTATQGLHRMRVVLSRNSSPNPDPCDYSEQFGMVDDFSIYVLGCLPATTADASCSSPNYDFIQEVDLGSFFANTSSCSGPVFEEYGAEPALVLGPRYSIGASVFVQVGSTGSTPNPLDMCTVWVDWNDGRGSTSYPMAPGPHYTHFGYPLGAGNNSFSVYITPPPGAPDGKCWMRVALTSSDDPTPCGSETTLNVEDYSIVVDNRPIMYPMDPLGIHWPGSVLRLGGRAVPGAQPTSTGLVVAANLSSLGGPIRTLMFDDGTHGDVTANDLNYSLAYTIPSTTAPGRYPITFTISDAQGRTNSAGTTVEITSPFCSADFNGDGDIGTDADIGAFFACLAGNCCTTCGSADFNGDGDIGTDADIAAFFRVLAGGPC